MIRRPPPPLVFLRKAQRSGTGGSSHRVHVGTNPTGAPLAETPVQPGVQSDSAHGNDTGSSEG
ncbi:hypothetical protein OPAG_05304 [Rhodococcus opacus PD630]|nr:hypothetical protein OPAG_05304 [Rhodococcus opacus PD630]